MALKNWFVVQEEGRHLRGKTGSLLMAIKQQRCLVTVWCWPTELWALLPPFELGFFFVCFSDLSSSFWIYICEVGFCHLITSVAGLTIIELWGTVICNENVGIWCQAKKMVCFSLSVIWAAVCVPFLKELWEARRKYLIIDEVLLTCFWF